MTYYTAAVAMETFLCMCLISIVFNSIAIQSERTHKHRKNLNCNDKLIMYIIII